MRKYFKADVQTVDFGESAAVAEQINGWVENHTESKGGGSADYPLYCELLNFTSVHSSVLYILDLYLCAFYLLRVLHFCFCMAALLNWWVCD